MLSHVPSELFELEYTSVSAPLKGQIGSEADAAGKAHERWGEQDELRFKVYSKLDANVALGVCFFAR